MVRRIEYNHEDIAEFIVMELGNPDTHVSMDKDHIIEVKP